MSAHLILIDLTNLPKAKGHRLAKVQARDVKCPTCHPAAGGAVGKRCGHGSSKWCKARLAIARKVAGILAAHFVVAERPCTGEAHSPAVGGMIDHCPVCMPHWGVVEYLTPIAAVESESNVVARAFATVEKDTPHLCAECRDDEGSRATCQRRDCAGRKLTVEPEAQPPVTLTEAAAALAPDERCAWCKGSGRDGANVCAACGGYGHGWTGADDKDAKPFGTLATAPNLSWKPEVIADDSGKFYGNALRFATKEEAEANVRDLSWRWMLVRETRVVESADPVNYQWDVERGLVSVRKES